LLLSIQHAHAEAQPAELSVLTTVGPWTYATRPIGFAGRIWFANANRWPDHNSADIWSMQQDGSNLRRERRLFSQDVGEPVVHQGLLYWPYEDPRVSLGWGQIGVTDGTDWRVLETRVGRQFHLHQINRSFDGLHLSASSWNAQVLQSTDRGANWSLVWERSREEKRFSRTYSVVNTGFGLVSDLMVFGQKPHTFGLFTHEDGVAVPVPGWPTDAIVEQVLKADFGVYGLIRNPQTGQRQLLEAVLDPGFLGSNPPRNLPLPEGVDPIDMDLKNRSALALLSRGPVPGRHEIWHRQDDQWSATARISGDAPEQIRWVGQQPVVAGSNNGKGTVWGAPVRATLGKDCKDDQSSTDRARAGVRCTRKRGSPAVLPAQITPQPLDRDEARHQIADALADPRSYVGHGIRLRNVIDKWIMRGLSGEVLAEFLDGPFPGGKVKLIGGRAHASHERFGRWVLTWGMRRAGNGRVPVAWLDQPFDEAENASQKYFGEKLAAIWTVAATGQDDRATVAALRRISLHPSLPEWLRQDAFWAIHVLRDQRGRTQ
jgi:hypothetical protein